MPNIYLLIGIILVLALDVLWILTLQDKVKRAEDELEVFRKVEQVKQKRFIDGQLDIASKNNRMLDLAGELDKSVKHLNSLIKKKKTTVNWDDELKGLKR